MSPTRSVPRTFIALLAMLACVAATRTETSAQEAGIVVSVEWLAENLDDPNIVVLHVGPQEAYATEHIPGAVFVDRMEMSHPDSHSDSDEVLILELPEAEAFEAALRSWGIDDDTRVVVAFLDERVTQTARLVFTLDWAGLGDRTSYLDGGITAWKAAGHPVSADTPAPANGSVTIRPRTDLVVEADWVQAHGMAEGYQLVDARAPAFFDGVREDRGVAGHIPGAGNVHWTTLVNEETLLLQPMSTLRGLFEAAGVEGGDTVVGYCHIGQYATLMLLTARMLGHDVVLYDGAFQDWATRGLPAEAGR